MGRKNPAIAALQLSGRTHARLVCLLITVICLGTSGCSMFVMAGKMLFGDPKIPAEFRKATGTDLTDGKDSVVIICSAPHRLTSEFPSLQIDLVDRVTRILETHNIKVVPSGDVASWYDDHGEWGDYSELAAEFDAKFVVHITLREFTHRVEESPNLLQGKADGHISVHRVSKSGSSKLTDRNFVAPVSLAFDRDIRLTYPKSYPVPLESRSEDLFTQGFMDRVALNISQLFYDYRMSDSID